MSGIRASGRIATRARTHADRALSRLAGNAPTVNRAVRRCVCTRPQSRSQAGLAASWRRLHGGEPGRTLRRRRAAFPGGGCVSTGSGTVWAPAGSVGRVVGIARRSQVAWPEQRLPARWPSLPVRVAWLVVAGRRHHGTRHAGDGGHTRSLGSRTGTRSLPQGSIGTLHTIVRGTRYV